MSNILYNILVPVDFSAKNRWAIAKAVELANALKCNIHLVHVVPQLSIPFLSPGVGWAFGYNSFPDTEYTGKMLKELKEEYQHHLCNGGKIEISVLHGNVQTELQKYIGQYEMDMVIKGMSRFNLPHRILSTLSISRLTRKINIPVLAVMSSGLVSHFKKIVLPLNEQVPMRRIRLATILGRYFKSTIYIISLRNERSNSHLPVLNETLEIIQSLTTIPVQSFILEGKNLAKTTLEFSKKINADLIMITPKKEFYLPGLWNRITQKLLSYKSKIPVITVDNNLQ